MTFTTDTEFQSAIERYRVLAAEAEQIASRVQEMADEMDDRAATCSCCGTVRYLNFAQHQMRQRINGAAERLREIGNSLRQRATDPDFHTERTP